MDKLDLVSFAIETSPVRVIQTDVGRAIPIVDIARAVDYPPNKMKEMVDRNEAQFDGMMGTVTVPTYAEQRSRDGGTHTMSRDVELRVLNVYGVVGLLMKLDSNRIQDESKRERVLRFQRWAMKVLGGFLMGRPVNGKEPGKLLRDLPLLPPGIPWLSSFEAAIPLGMSYRTVRRWIKRGRIRAYRTQKNNYAIPVCEITRIREENRERALRGKRVVTMGGKR